MFSTVGGDRIEVPADELVDAMELVYPDAAVEMIQAVGHTGGSRAAVDGLVGRLEVENRDRVIPRAVQVKTSTTTSSGVQVSLEGDAVVVASGDVEAYTFRDDFVWYLTGSAPGFAARVFDRTAGRVSTIDLDRAAESWLDGDDSFRDGIAGRLFSLAGRPGGLE